MKLRHAAGFLIASFRGVGAAHALSYSSVPLPPQRSDSSCNYLAGSYGAQTGSITVTYRLSVEKDALKIETGNGIEEPSIIPVDGKPRTNSAAAPYEYTAACRDGIVTLIKRSWTAFAPLTEPITL